MTDDKKLFDYFDLKEALDDAIFDIEVGSLKDCAKSSSKLLGKTIFNTGLLLGKVGIETLKNFPDYALKQAETRLSDDENLSAEERKKLETFVQKYKK